MEQMCKEKKKGKNSSRICLLFPPSKLITLNININSLNNSKASLKKKETILTIKRAAKGAIK